MQMKWKSRAALAGLSIAASLVAGPTAPAVADATATPVIDSWTRTLASANTVVLSATQRTGVALFASAPLRRQADGSLTTGEISVYFSGRQASLPAPPVRPIQNFDAARADRSTFTLTRAGRLIERSRTWGFTQTIDLTATGGQMLAGWGGSIGNLGDPSYWVVGVSSTPVPAARPDPAAAAVIAGWSRQLGREHAKPFELTVTQGARGGGGVVMAYTGGSWTHGDNGSLRSGAGFQFSDRVARIPGRPAQPFDAARVDQARLTLTPAGTLIEQNLRWGYTQTINLRVRGQVLTGWGRSIGNSGAPAQWVLATSPRDYQIPG